MANLTKPQQIIKLRELCEKNKGTRGATRGIPHHELVDLDTLFDRFKVPGEQWAVPTKYYAQVIKDRTNGKRLDEAALVAKILDENPGVQFIP